MRRTLGPIHPSRFTAGLVLLAFACSGPPLETRTHHEVPVTPMNLAAKPANNSPMLAADPTDERFVALANRLDSPDFGCALQVSGDGGNSWLSANPVPRLPAGAEKCYAPEIAFDSQGNLLYLFVGLRGEGNEPMGAYLTTSRDRARSFSPPQQVLGPLRFGVRMAVESAGGRKGRIHLAWLEARADPPLGGFGPPPNPILHSYSDDGGRTFSEPQQVSDTHRDFVVAPALATGAGGRVHVMYYDLGKDARDYHGLEGPRWEGNWSLVMATSRDSGKSFSEGVVVEPEVTPAERVMLIFTMPPASVATAENGRVWVGWHDARNGDWDVFVRSSGDGGRRWSAPVRVNDDPLGNGRHQYLPRLAATPGGRLDAVFYDRRGNIENRGNDVTYAFSQSPGGGFSANRIITSLNFDSRIGPRYAVVSADGLFEFGARLGLVSREHEAIAAWTDTRNTGRGAPSQDIFSLKLEVGRRGGWALPGVAAAGAVSAVLLLLWMRRGRGGVARRAPETGEAAVG